MRPMWLWQCLAAQLCRVAVSNIFWIYYFLFFEWFRQFDSCTFIHYNIQNFPRCFEIWFMFFFALWLFLIFHVTIVSKPYNCLNIIIGKGLLITFCELDVKKVLSSLSIRFIEFFFFFSSVPDKTPTLLTFLLILQIWKWSDKSAYINLFLVFRYIPNYWKICCQLVSW